ncbi:hypothetical protein GGR04_002318 [Aureimonas pseudogalii]|uniref:Uncharacterized protein n=1 Tax=Aureimonas pseudogalii TaxID=1744844 RepID=A0A7W6H4I7_9HYPH|nr:hypothetical protein [Aureimonas pseudogalii]
MAIAVGGHCGSRLESESEIETGLDAERQR